MGPLLYWTAFRHISRSSVLTLLFAAMCVHYVLQGLMLPLFGPEGFLAVLVGNLITSILMLPLTIILVRVSGKREAGHGWDDALHILGSSLVSALMSPIVWLPVLGMILSFSHVTLPEPVLSDDR